MDVGRALLGAGDCGVVGTGFAFGLRRGVAAPIVDGLGERRDAARDVGGGTTSVGGGDLGARGN